MSEHTTAATPLTQELTTAESAVAVAAAESEDDAPPCENCDGLGIVELGYGPSAYEARCPECSLTDEEEEHDSERWAACCDALRDKRSDDRLTGEVRW